MSPEQDPRQPYLDDEQAFHAALDPEAASDGLDPESLAAWHAELELLRTIARRDDELLDAETDDAELVRTILGKTTREDLSWRGELRLVGGFLRGHWNTSVLVRVVAASLVAHIAALPLLGYLGVFDQRETGSFRTAIELPPAPVPEPEEQPSVIETDPLELELVDLEQEDSLSLARFHLRGPAPSARTGDAHGPSTRLLALRSGYLAGEMVPLEQLPVVGAAPRLEALAVEHLLDRFVLEEELPSGLEERLASLRSQDVQETGDQLLVLSSLVRARSYGLLDGAPEELTGRAEALAGTPAGPLAEQLLLGASLRPGCPLDEAWLDALRLALGSELLADPAGLAWASWSTQR